MMIHLTLYEHDHVFIHCFLVVWTHHDELRDVFVRISCFQGVTGEVFGSLEFPEIEN